MSCHEKCKKRIFPASPSNVAIVMKNKKHFSRQQPPLLIKLSGSWHYKCDNLTFLCQLFIIFKYTKVTSMAYE